MSGSSGGNESKDALADYMRALQKLNGSNQSAAADDSGSDAMAGPEQGINPAELAPPPSPAEKTTSEADSLEPDGPGMAGRDQTASEQADSMSLYLQALSKVKQKQPAPEGSEPGEAAQGSRPAAANLDVVRGALKAEAGESQTASASGAEKRTGTFRNGLDRLRQRGPKAEPTKVKKTPRRIPAAAEVVPMAPLSPESEAPLVLEPAVPPRKTKSKPARKPKAKVTVKPKRAGPQGGVSAAPFNASPRMLKVGAFLVCLAVGLMLQRLIYSLAGLPYALNDLGIGATLALPVLLVLVLVRPQTRSDWMALLASAAAIAVTGGLGVALGISLLHTNALAMHETGYLMQLFVHLLILTLIWGPVFLIVTGLLHRMELLKLSDSMEF